MTVLEVIKRSTEFLARRGVDSPRLQAELLLAHQLQVPRMRLYLDFERVLSEPELSRYRELVQRRGQREPLQHLLGSTSFCGLEIHVDRRVLVPRPETELLAERGWTFLTERSGPGHAPVSALDFGTGSGCLAIALAVKCPEAVVRALDISAEALELARQNATSNGVADRIQFHQGNALGALPAGAAFDLIISNPPYIPSGEISSLQPEVRNFDPRVALDGGAGGLDFYTHLAAEGGRWLSRGGKIMVEFGDEQQVSVRSLFERQNWIVEEVLEDYTQRPRILIARCDAPAALHG